MNRFGLRGSCCITRRHTPGVRRAALRHRPLPSAHKERNVLDYLPKAEKSFIRRKLRAAWANPDWREAKTALEALAAQLELRWSDAASSLREGLAETVTINKLGITGTLARTLATTNPIESTIEILKAHAHNVKNWTPPTGNYNNSPPPSPYKPTSTRDSRRPHNITPGPPRSSTRLGTSSIIRHALARVAFCPARCRILARNVFASAASWDDPICVQVGGPEW